MFRKGDYIVYKTEGVCKVKEITAQNGSSGSSGQKLYYVLTPLKDEGLTIYSPVDNEAIPRRLLMTKQEAREMVRTMETMPQLDIPSEKHREDCYKKALRSTDAHAWIQVAKTIHQRKESRALEGKKSTAVDEHYLKAASELLLDELSVVFGVSRETAEQYLKGKMTHASNKS